MIPSSLEYLLPTGEILVLSSEAMAVMRAHRQRRLFSKEAGGQLFAVITESRIEIVEATGPGWGDWRSRFGFRPNRKREQQEIDSHYKIGMHFVGDWHTHPERTPTPSSTDLESMREMVTHSKHALFGYIMMIVGTGEEADCLHVSIHRPESWIILQPQNGLSQI